MSQPSEESKKDDVFIGVEHVQDYFVSVYEKLQSDYLFHKKAIKHSGTRGTENEKALAGVIREFLPAKFGVDTDSMLVDRHGKMSRQVDIVIYSKEYPKYFHKIFPIETVYATIEVKTTLNKATLGEAIENAKSIHALDYIPELTYYWQNQVKEKGIKSTPPECCLFAYASKTNNLATMCDWFNEHAKDPRDIGGSLLSCLLDFGLFFDRGDSYVYHSQTGQLEDGRSVVVKYPGGIELVDPAKVLTFFLEKLWVRLHGHRIHPAFDIRSYMPYNFQTFAEFYFSDVEDLKGVLIPDK
ncbi:DUF6602 domain-containing protein [Pseudodesulfovibrio karagichevae]|uniref:DUF6602 domain-containing protein n=1 Tax=Pseudodesulfovibrio karagichevae TaxID=3239305 RepID=A0ABV4JXE0_9BACT